MFILSARKTKQQLEFGKLLSPSLNHGRLRQWDMYSREYDSVPCAPAPPYGSFAFSKQFYFATLCVGIENTLN